MMHTIHNAYIFQLPKALSRTVTGLDCIKIALGKHVFQMQSCAI